SSIFEDEAAADHAIEELKEEFEKRFGRAAAQQPETQQRAEQQQEPAKKRLKTNLMEQRRLDRVQHAATLQREEQGEGGGAAAPAACEIQRYLDQPLEVDAASFSLLAFWKEKGSPKLDLAGIRRGHSTGGVSHALPNGMPVPQHRGHQLPGGAQLFSAGKHAERLAEPPDAFRSGNVHAFAAKSQPCCGH
ncbi:unnamed protein product, partial [Phaeothamnion confervicola]